MGNQRDVVVSSSDSENSASLLGNTQDASSDAPPLETEPHETVVDAKQAYIAKTAADHDNNAIFPMLATLSGAMLASGVGWYLVRPGPRDRNAAAPIVKPHDPRMRLGGSLPTLPSCHSSFRSASRRCLQALFFKRRKCCKIFACFWIGPIGPSG